MQATGGSAGAMAPGASAVQIARDTASLVAATAANLADWHDLMLTELGHETRHSEGWWLTPDQVPLIFFNAISLRPTASAAVAANDVTPHTWIAVCDPWADVGLAALGFAIEGDHSWMCRPAGPVEGPHPPGLSIERVMEADALADFELASAAGFGSSPQRPFSWHAPSILADPRLVLWRGRRGGRTVSTAMSFVHAGVVGVYGVSTVPDARRQGFAGAMTRVAMAADAALPSVLQPSSMAEPLYRALGYRAFTTFRTWTRPPRPPGNGGAP